MKVMKRAGGYSLLDARINYYMTCGYDVPGIILLESMAPFKSRNKITPGTS
jgi:hypothetical protein